LPELASLVITLIDGLPSLNTLTNVIHPFFGYSISSNIGLIQYRFHQVICSNWIEPVKG